MGHETSGIRRNALYVLLSLGPLTFSEIERLTGWAHSTAWAHLSRLLDDGYVRKVGVTTKYNRPIFEAI